LDKNGLFSCPPSKEDPTSRFLTLTALSSVPPTGHT
jgi:hypothetical protein